LSFLLPPGDNQISLVNLAPVQRTKDLKVLP